MNNIPVRAKFYLLNGLTGTPDVLDGLLKDKSSDNPIWDNRPDPERFTLREVIAHLADWEPIWLERILRILKEDEPSLPGYDEGQYAIDRDYAHSDPQENLRRFRNGRQELIAILSNVKEDEWDRVGLHAEIGKTSAFGFAVLIAGHDGYHTRQVAQWLEAAKNI